MANSAFTAGTVFTGAVGAQGAQGATGPSSPFVIQILVSDPNGGAITTGDGKTYIAIPAEFNGLNLVGCSAHVSTVSSSGIPTVQLRRVRSGASADMLTTKLTIDANEKDSSTAATSMAIDTANDDVLTGDEIHVDIDVAGTGAKGLVVTLKFA